MVTNGRILIVEDEGLVARTVADTLKEAGYEVVDRVMSGEAAVRVAQQTRPSVVLMDIRLKGAVDGIEAAATITEQMDIPVVYLTAYADEETLSRAKVTKPYGYILKPFQPRELITAIEIAQTKHRLEQKLHASEQWLKTTLSSIEDAVLATDEQCRVKFMNGTAAALTGWTNADAAGRPVADVFHIIEESTGERVSIPTTSCVAAAAALPTDAAVILEGRFSASYPICCSASPIVANRGTDNERILGLVLVFHDETARREAQRRLKRSRAKYRDLVENIAEVILTLDRTGTISYISPAVEAFGHDPKNLVGRRFTQFVYPADRDRVEELFDAALGALPSPAEFRVVTADNGARWVQCSSRTIVGEEGAEVRGVRIVLHDITNYKLAEDQRRHFFTLTADILAILDRKLRFVQLNPAARTLTGHMQKALEGELFETFLHPRDRTRVMAKLDHLRSDRAEGSLSFECRIRCKSGSYLWLGWDVTGSGTQPAYYAVARDISARKRAEEEMRRRMMQFLLEDGHCYLSQEPDCQPPFTAFGELSSVGYQGLVIARTPEERLRRRHRLEAGTRILWLATNENEGATGAGDFSSFAALERAVDTLPPRSVVLIERLDFLIFHHGFDATLSFLHRLRDRAYIDDLIVLLCIDAHTVTPRELRMIETECEPLQPRPKIPLEEEQLEIVQYLYEQDLKGTHPCHGDLCDALGISRPTARKRLRKLIYHGYVQEEKAGNAKIVSLSEKGRRILLSEKELRRAEGGEV